MDSGAVSFYCFPELRKYCNNVAAVVGLILKFVFGINDDYVK